MKWLVGGLVAVALMFAGVYGLLRAESRTTTDEAGNTILNFGALAIPVTDDDPLPGRPPIFRGEVVSPEPRFDLEPLGDDLSLVMGEPDRAALETLGGDQNLFGWFGRAVYVGDDLDSDPVFLFQQTGPSIVDLVKGWFSDFETTGIYGSTYDCCRSQSADGSQPVLNQPTFGNSQVGDRLYATAEMWAIQSDVAVIAFTDENDEPLGWQRPVSGYVGARFEAAPDAAGLPNIRMIAYNADGEILQDASWAPPPLDDSFGG